VGDQGRVHTVLELGSVLDQMQTEPGTLALGPDGRVGQPDLGDELEPGQLGQHPGIDPVRLAGQRGEPLHLDRVGDPHIPTSQLELVVDEAGAAHRLDHS
jgi:hypothetical protein